MITTDNNKLIAEFLGFQQTNLGWYDAEEVLLRVERDNTFDNLKFHTDWNWLMNAVDKIEGMTDSKGDAYRFNIDMCNVDIEGTDIQIIGEAYKIVAVYRAVVEFIKWYNNNN